MESDFQKSILEFLSQEGKYLLPRTLYPIDYRVTITVDIKEDFFHGNALIYAMAKENTSKIVFNSFELEYDLNCVSVAKVLQSKEKIPLTIETMEFDQKHQTTTILLKEELAENEYLELGIKYKGIMRDSKVTTRDLLRGFYKSEVPEGKLGYTNVSVTQFQPCSCRQAFPCWDEPFFKSTFNVSIVCAEELVCLSNTNEIKTTLLGEIDESKKGMKMKKVEFKKTPKMSTYLVCWAVGDLVNVEGKTKNGTKVRVFSTEEEGIEKKLKFVMDFLIKMVDFYEDLFKIKYSDIMEKLDLLAIDDFCFVAMENWGLITYKKSRLLVDENSPLKDQLLSFKTISHEVFHMWWGNLITLLWWNDLWIHEGFARWIEKYGLMKYREDFYMEEFFQDSVSCNIQFLDSRSDVKPVSQKLFKNSPKDILSHFNGLTYDKMGCVLRYLCDWIGKENMFKGMRMILKKHYMSSVVMDDVSKCLGEASRKNVKDFLHCFINYPGNPVVSAKIIKNEEQFFLRLKQRRYYKNPVHIVQEEKPWFLPMKIYLGKTNDILTVILKDKTMNVPLPKSFKNEKEDWIYINHLQQGYYRSLYSNELFERLYVPIEKNMINNTEKIGLLYDCFIFFEDRKSKFKVDDLEKFLSCFGDLESNSTYVKSILGVFLERFSQFKSFKRFLEIRREVINKRKLEEEKKKEISIEQTGRDISRDDSETEKIEKEEKTSI